MKKIPIKALIPTGIMMTGLSTVGAYLYLFTDRQIFWPGFVSMLFFYGLIFFVGSYIAAQKSNDQN